MESMEGQYGLSSDLRRLITAEDTFSGHRPGLVGQIMGEVMMVFPPPPPQQQQQQQKPLERFEQFCCESNGGGGGGGGGGIYEEGCSKARWPRQETLTLLEIRARLDPKFREASHKALLWDEVSRTMAEEHGYQRSGKKCREKLENLNKYYKKTKEGRAGRQDGKHYRFFRQLEALYGDKQITFTSPIKDFNINHSITTSNHHHYFPTISNNNPDAFQAAPKLSESLSLPNHSSEDFLETSSSDEEDDGRKGCKSKMREFVDSQMRRLIEVQEAFLDKMLKTLEKKERERMLREEAWRREEMIRLEREHKLWAIERAWVEARDVVLMKALSRITGDDYVQWREIEVSSLVRQKGEGDFEGMRIQK